MQDIIDKCREWAKQQPKGVEPCAAVLLRKGRVTLEPLKNMSSEPDKYFQAGDDFALLQLKGEILYVVHAHDGESTPSEYDVACSNAIRIPYIILGGDGHSYSVVHPRDFKVLSGLSYEFGKQDCFETARDWYLAHGILLPARKEWIDDWWLEGFDYIKDLDKEWPFKPTTGLEYGNLITFAVEADQENHLGIYLDNDIFFHHAFNRLSGKEPLYPFWGSYIKKVYKYEGSDIKRIFR